MSIYDDLAIEEKEALNSEPGQPRLRILSPNEAEPSIQEASRPGEVASQSEPRSIYEEVVAEERVQRDDDLRKSVMSVVEKDPNQMAEIQKLSEQTGIAQDVIERNYSRFLYEKRLAEVNITTRMSPFLARQMTDPNFAALAYDDTQNLSTLESIMTKGKDITKSTLGGVTQAAGGTLSGISEMNDVLVRRIDSLLSQVLPRSTMDLLRSPISPVSPQDLFLGRPGRALKELGQEMQPPEARRGLDTDVAGAIGQLGFQIASYLLTGGLSSTVMLTGQGADIMADKVREDDAPQANKDAAIIAGSGITAITERYGLDKILNRVPPKIRNRTLRFLADTAMTYGNEFAQEVVENLLHDLVRQTLTNENAPIFEGALEEGNVAGIAAAIVRAGLGARRYKQSRDQQRFIEELANATKESQLLKRMPARFREFAATLVKDGPVQNVYIDANRFNTLYQSKGMDPRQVAVEIGAKNYDEAVETGSDIVIPMETFAEKVAPSDDLQDLMPDLRLGQDVFTAREAEEYARNQDEILNQIRADAEAATREIQTPELQAIKDAAVQELIDAGYEPRTAEAYATVHTKAMMNLAERAGMTPQEMMEAFELSITRPLPEVLTKNQAADLGIDPLIDRLRAGDLPQQRDVYGETLIDFLIKKGGVQPSGELMDVEKQRRGLIKLTGMSADDAASLAVQAGYFTGRTTEEITADDLIEAIQEELGGTIQYAEAQVNRELMALMNQLEGLDEFLRALNIDLEQITDNAEVRRLMDQAARTIEDPEIQDALNRLFQAIPQEQVLFQSGRIRDDYTIDMFGVPEEEGARAKPDEPELPFTEDEVPGTFAARTEVVKESVKDIGEPIVQTEEQAAQALAYLARGADERFDALITDKDGKPLAIVGSFKGTYNQAAVYPATLTSEAFRIKGAANIWFAHNHPSGNAKLSESDIRLHKRLIEAFRGSAIEPRGLFAIGGKIGKGREWTMVDVDDSMVSSATGAPRTGVEVPVVERILTMEDRLGPQIKNPEMAETAVVEVSGGENGVVLLDAQNRPLAFVPVDPAEASQLRVPGRMDQLYRAISMANPSAAMIANSGMSDAMARNVAGLFGSLDIRVLDVIEIENGVGKSRAKSGYTYTEDVFRQGEAADRRGMIQFGPRVPGKKRKFKMSLLEKADLSTFLHESGHFYLEVLGDLAEMPQASQQLKDDYAKILEYLGAESRADITLDGKTEGSAEYNRAVEMHEKFARSNEAYLMEGKAPSLDLREIFQRFKNWLKQIYKTLTSLNVELTDEVRSVFDRIYATDQEIEAARSELEVSPVFLDAESAGMTQAEFEAYRASVSQATESAKEALQQKLMNQLMRERKAWWKEERAKVKEEVTAEVDALPIYQAFKELTEGETKLDRDELVGRYGKEYLKRLPRSFKRIYAVEGGMPIEAAARLMGYGNADQFIKALVEMRPRKEYIEAETDRVMKERHGDMLLDGTISDEAVLALHNNQREKVLAAELRALRRKQREVRPFVQAEREKARQERRAAREAFKMPPVSAFRRAARESIAETKVRDLEPQRYLNAQRKHNKESQKLVLQGKYKEAADAKQKEMLNHFLYLEARKARERADVIAKNMAKFDKKTTRQRIGKAGKTYLEQIDAILDGYEFRRISLRALDRRAKLNDFVARQQEEGEPVNIPQSVLDDARQINYRELTVGELEAVNEAVQNIANLARIKNKLLFIAEKRELNEVAGDAIDHIRANSKKGKQRKLETALPSERIGRWAKGFMLIHTKFSTIFRQMDGWKDGGMMWNLIVRPLNERANWETVRKTEATERLREIFTVYRGTDMFAKKFIPGLNQSMSLQGRLMVALNWGRAENRQRLIDGNKFTQTEIDAILDSLEERDWKFVKDIWEHLNSYWPEISEQYEKLYGIPPEKVEPLPFETKYGTMPGGYFPIKYDPIRSTQTQAQTIEESTKLMKSGAYVRSQTKNGYTKETLENLDRAIKLDFSSIYEHTSEVIHDLALREYLIDFNKVMNHRVGGTTLKDTINEYYGDQVLREINDTIRDVTAGDIIPQNAFESALTHLRAGVSIAFMGWNLVTGLMQPLGLTQSMVRIGPKWVAKGIKKWGSNAIQLQSSAKVIYEKSEFMRTRYLTQNREINEIRNVLKRQGRFPIFKEGYGAVEDSFFFFIVQFQKTVDFPTWFGQYEKSLAQGADEKKAIAMADQAVIQSQASGLIKDLAKIERGTGLMKIWTNFYSYFNTTLNLTQEAFGKTNFRNPFDIGRLASDVAMLLVVPAILGFAIRESVRLLAGGEERDEEELIAGLLREQVGYLMGTVVGLREFATMFDPRFGYAGPAGVRFIAEFEGLATQISQGDLDTALRKRAVNSAGILLHFPSNQVNRILDGIMALEDERTESPAAVLFGLPR